MASWQRRRREEGGGQLEEGLDIQSTCKYIDYTESNKAEQVIGVSRSGHSYCPGERPQPLGDTVSMKGVHGVPQHLGDMSKKPPNACRT